MDAWEKMGKILEGQGVFLPSYNNEAERFHQIAVVKDEQLADHSNQVECLEKMKRIMRVPIRP